jgi:hypothetical protein
MMASKRDQMNANFAVADALLGKTTGASKGSKPAPKATFKVRPLGGIKNITEGPQGFKATWERKF